MNEWNVDEAHRAQVIEIQTKNDRRKGVEEGQSRKEVAWEDAKAEKVMWKIENNRIEYYTHKHIT